MQSCLLASESVYKLRVYMSIKQIDGEKSFPPFHLALAGDLMEQERFSPGPRSDVNFV